MSQKFSKIVYYRVPTSDERIESQRAISSSEFDKEFDDVGASGAILATKRLEVARLLTFRRGSHQCQAWVAAGTPIKNEKSSGQS